MPETLLRVDFAEPTLPSELGTITPEQQEAINTLLENKQSTAYLTQAELTDLQQLLTQGQTDAATEFISNQLDEGLASSDIASQSVEYSEQLDLLDAYAKEILFGSNGVLQGVEDPTAQDHMAVGFAMSLLTQIAPDEDISAEDFEGIINGGDDTFTADIIAKLSLLSDVPDTMFQAGGKENSICMDVNQSLEFFNELFSDDLSDAGEIETRLVGANTLDDIELSFEGLDTAIITQIQDIAARMQAGGALPTGGLPANGVNTNSGSPEPEEELNWLERILEILNDILKDFASFFSNEESNETTNPQGGVVDTASTTIDVSSAQISETYQFFTNSSQIIVDGMPASIFATLFSDEATMGDYEKSIIENVAAFHESDSITDGLTTIFVETLPSSADDTLQVPRIERFLQERNAIKNDNFSIRNTDGSINVVNLQILIRRYQDYSVGDFNDTADTPEEEITSFGEYWAAQ